MRHKTPHLKVAIDLGASATKAIGSMKGESNFLPILITPHCYKAESALRPDPDFDENSIWIELGKDVYAVGRYAEIKYQDIIKVRPAKTTNAIPKICAVIALFAQKFQLPAKFNVSISFVLPPAEWGQKDLITGKLGSLESIKTPAGIITPTLADITASPEGLGILLGQGLDPKTFGFISVVMLGYRNASILTSNYGLVERPQTSDLGFHSLVKDVSSHTGYKIDDAIEPIFKYRQAMLMATTASAALESHTYKMERAATTNPDRQMYQDLMKQDQEQIATSKVVMHHSFDTLSRCVGEDKEFERRIAIEAVNKATAKHINSLSVWLDEMLPTASDRICLCGGTANYLGTALDSFLIDKLKSKSRQDLHLNSRLTIPMKFKQQVDADRYADIYSLWFQMTNQLAVAK
jgi:hypothetical protein